MTNLTQEERAAQSRANGARSRGPTSAEGKLRSRANALKHGLRAEVLPMPGEDPAFAAGRVQEWVDFYRPKSPAARHLTTACALATVFSDRVDAYITADAVRRSEQVGADGDAEQYEKIAALTRHFGTHAAMDALAELRSFAAGCRWLIGHWERIAASLARYDVLGSDEIDTAADLLGPARYGMFEELALALAPRGRRDPGNTVTESARARLDALIAYELAGLRADEARLVTLDEAAASAADPALLLVPQDHATARLHLRYQAEARSGFLRLWKALEAVLKQDAASPNEPDCESGCGLDAEATAHEDGGPKSDPSPAQAAPPNEPGRAQAAPPNEPGRVVEVARKATVVNAPAVAPVVRRERMVLDGGGGPSTFINMCMVPLR